ncbi:MAG: glycosyltransferase family 4 protein [Pseudomonadota bacterium]
MSAVVLSASGMIALCVAFIAAHLLARTSFLPDLPNERSSHARPTPRSGGIAITLGFLAAVAVAIAGDALPSISHEGGAELSLTLMIFAAFASVAAAVGFIDDRFELAPLVKLLSQIVLAIAFVGTFGGLTGVPAPVIGSLSLPGWLGSIISTFWIVAFINGYNFMDGANGIASSAAIVVSAALAAAAAATGSPVVVLCALATSFALIGFLRLNFPEGRLFMGDSGSHAVGFILASLPLIATRDSGLTPLFVPIAMAPFLADVAFTLVRRGLARKPLLQAHRDHIYQLMLKSGATHTRVTAWYAAGTAFCTGVALAVATTPASVQWSAVFAIYGGALLVFVSVIRSTDETRLERQPRRRLKGVPTSAE